MRQRKPTTSQTTVTIHDVATAAGVSSATVSRALNDSPKVTPQTKQRVAEAVKRTGFVMNAQGRALALGQAGAIAILITEPLDELFSDPTFAVIVRGISERLAATPHLPSLLQASTDYERERAQRHFERRAVDAVIDISPYVGGSVLSGLRDSHLPVVLCGQLEGEPYSGVFSTVYSDDVEGAKLAARAMLERGRRQIAVILGPRDNPATADRLAGYRAALGPAYQPDLCLAARSWDEESGYQVAKQLLVDRPDIDGILAAGDRIAVGAICASQQAGRLVPTDLSVIGFDDHAIAKSCLPPLTTVHQPLLEEGALAAEKALDMIAGAVPSTTVLDMSLVRRESL